MLKGMASCTGAGMVAPVRQIRVTIRRVLILIATAQPHHTRQALTGIMGCPVLQPKAWPNSGMFCTTPFARNCRGE